MKLLILAPGKASKSTQMIFEESKKLFDEVDLFAIEDVILETSEEVKAYCGDKDLSGYDYMLPRIDSKRASFGYHVVKFFDLINMRKPYSAEAIPIAHNKFSTLFEFRKNGVVVPDTYFTSSKKSAEELVRKMKFPAMVKLVSSYGGKGVMYIESRQAAMSVVKTLNLLKQDLMLEKFIENPGEDMRGFLIGDEIIGMKRIAKKGEKRANVSAGGKAVTYTLNDEEKEIVFKTAKILNAKICAIDMINGKDGAYVIEANINPGLQGITKATGINLAQRIAKFCYEEAKK
ncbi:MAG: RimK family alpha-L-glutamate ligase [Candidatus Aenigmarchaeota archaeon]|nr:RimK family alpha-L-glutamate ligase [Candidatus Aenigmarchaeota archaeon]